jgi:hypothetical protein
MPQPQAASDLPASVSSKHRGHLSENDQARHTQLYFVDSHRSISATMRSRPASLSASLRGCPSGILRASAMIFVARTSQLQLWADCKIGRVADFCTPNIWLFTTLDVAYDRFAYVVHKLGERPVFLLTEFQFPFQFRVVNQLWLPQRGLGLGGSH